MLPNLSCLHCRSSASASVEAPFERFRYALDDISIDPRRKRSWDEDATCAICLGLLRDEDELGEYGEGSTDVEAIVEHPNDEETDRPRCNHVFHTTCLIKHIAASPPGVPPRCPICKITIPSETVQRLAPEDILRFGEGRGNAIMELDDTDDEGEEADEEPESVVVERIERYIDSRRNDVRGPIPDLKDEFEAFAAANAPGTRLPPDLERWRRAALYKRVTELRRDYQTYQARLDSFAEMEAFYREAGRPPNLSATTLQSRAALRDVRRLTFKQMEKVANEAMTVMPFLSDSGRATVRFP